MRKNLDASLIDLAGKIFKARYKKEDEPISEIEKKAFCLIELWLEDHPESELTLEEALRSGYSMEICQLILSSAIEENEASFLEWYDTDSVYDHVHRAMKHALLIDRSFEEWVKNDLKSFKDRWIFSYVGAWMLFNRQNNKAYLNAF